MNRIKTTFHTLTSREEKALIGYVIGGFPDPSKTQEILRTMVASGCDLIELGVPFSDPIADGPVIQDANFKALCHGITVDWCFNQVRAFRKSNQDTPILLMGYCNPFWRYGLRQLAVACKTFGVDGLIIADLPIEASIEWRTPLEDAGIILIPFLAPTTAKDRIPLIAKHSDGFVYCISQTGITGSELSSTPPSLEENLSLLRSHTTNPTALGFGISTSDQAKQYANLCDGVIVGSAIIRAIKEYDSVKSTDKLRELIFSIKCVLQHKRNINYATS